MTRKNVVLCAACALAVLFVPLHASAAGFGAPDGPSYRSMMAVRAKALRLTNRAASAENLRLQNGRIAWLTGHPRDWTFGAIQNVQKWVANGNVAWIEAHLARAIGPYASVGGSVESAVVAKGAQNHPLLEGVSLIEAGDTFAYMRGLPTGAQALLTEWNRDDHVVLAVWPIDEGVIIICPSVRSRSSRPHDTVFDGWLDSNRSDGLRLIYNICAFSLKALGKPLN